MAKLLEAAKKRAIEARKAPNARIGGGGAIRTGGGGAGPIRIGGGGE